MAEMCPLCLYQSVHHVSGLYTFPTCNSLNLNGFSEACALIFLHVALFQLSWIFES